MKQPTVFLVEEDEDTRILFRKILKNNGYNVLLAIDETDALQRVGDEFRKIDVVFVNLVRKSSEQMLKAGRRICEKGELNVSLVAIAEEFDDELQGTSVQVGANEYVTYLENGTELFDLLFRLTNNFAGKISELKKTSSQFVLR
jgi:PleD family two-component response regulator